MCMRQHIYPVLAAYRRKLGMSQQELAALAGLRREKVNRIESKAEDVGFEELCRLLDAVGLELHVSEKGQANALQSVVSPDAKAQPSRFERHLVPQDFRKAAFIDGSKAKILNWGKVPK